MSGSATFARLPTELRHCIWNLVLGSDGDAPTMVPFRTTRPYMLEEEDDDEDMILAAEDAGEIISEEQFEEIRQLALHHITGQSGTGGPVNPAPSTLPSNGVAREVNAESRPEATETNGGPATKTDEQDNEGTAPGATNEAPIEIADGDDGEEEEDEDEEEEEEEDEDDEDPEFEPGNPYTQERAWDDEVVIPVYGTPPLLLVNREARSIALSWLKKHDIQLIRNTIGKGEIEKGFALNKDGAPPYARKFNPERDHLYVDRHYWRRFCDRLQMPHMMAPDEEYEEEPIHDIGETIKNLALPAFTMYQSVGTVGHILEYLPNIQQISCIWGDLPEKEWQPKIIYETVKRDGKPKTQVTNILVPRWDQEQISEKLSQEELDRRKADTEKIKAERQQERQAKQERKQKAEQEGKKDEDDEDDDSDDDEDDEEEDGEEEEGSGPIVTMCVRDPTDDSKVFHERGYLGDWLNEIYNELSICELPEHVTDEEDGSVTLPIVPCNIVKRQ